MTSALMSALMSTLMSTLMCALMRGTGGSHDASKTTPVFQNDFPEIRHTSQARRKGTITTPRQRQTAKSSSGQFAPISDSLANS